MRLIVVGRPTGRGVDQLLIRDATNYFGEILLRHDIPRLGEIELTVTLRPDLYDDFGRAGCSGWLDNRQRPDKFYVDLDSSLTHDTSLIALAHEMTHVKQMAMGERQECINLNNVRWLGQILDISDMDYYDLPWEIEAHGREYGLFDRFIQSISNVELEPAKIVDYDRKLKIA